MERPLMFVNQHSENGHISNSDLQIQCNCNQNSNGILLRSRKDNPNIHHGQPKQSSAKNNTGGITAPDLRQTTEQQKKTQHGVSIKIDTMLVEQNRAPISKIPQLQPETYSEEKVASATNGAGNTGQSSGGE